MPSPTLEGRFRGAMLGLAVGDALGRRFEGVPGEYVHETVSDVQALRDLPLGELWYTDDTQMAIGVAEALIDRGTIEEDRLCRAFAENYVPSRGYGMGARRVLEAMVAGEDHRHVAANHMPGGSFGNGAAMRVAPVGLAFRDDPGRIVVEARASALPTHVHPLGIEGAVLLALAVGMAVRGEDPRGPSFYKALLAHCQSPEYRAKLEAAAGLTSAAGLATLGNGIQAVESVPTAIAAFALASDSYIDAIGQAILLGGDTDTIAAMAGSLAGAYLGIDAIPADLLRRLERTPKGRDYIEDLARKLHRRFGAGTAATATT